jgi:hypothetical protein
MTEEQTRSNEPGVTEPGGTGPAPAEALAPALAGGSRARWLIGLGVFGIALAGTIGAIILLGARPTPEALRYLPGDTAIVGEIRMDLPGDQLQKVGNLLAHFPGFQDQAILPDKIDEALSRLVSSAGGGVDYRVDIKPWLAGAAFFSAAMPDPSDPDAKPAPLVSATTNGAVDCGAAIEGTVSHETYRGLDLVVSADGMLACVIDGNQALLGDLAAIKAGLDAKADGTGMDRSEEYRTARAALAGDQLATFYVDGSAFEAVMPQPSLAAPMPAIGALQGLAGEIPAWMIVGIRAEDDALVMDTIASAEPVAPPTAGAAPTHSALPLPPTHPSAITTMLPADTIAFFEHQGTGVALRNLLTKLEGIPELAPSLGMLDAVGGGEQLIDWIDDAGIAVLAGGGTPSGGAFLVARDEGAAADRVSTIRSLLAFAGGAQGIEIAETTIAGVTVTTVTVTDPSAFIPPGSIPGGGVPSLDVPIQLSFAAKGRVILVGVGEGFMPSVLNVQPGSSLADQVPYKAALARGLGNSRASMYVGIPAAIDLVEGFVPAEELTRWQSDVLPYIEPFQVVSMTASEDESTRRSRVVITVSNP